MVVPERLRSILGDRDVNVSRSCERRFVAAFISRRDGCETATSLGELAWVYAFRFVVRSTLMWSVRHCGDVPCSRDVHLFSSEHLPVPVIRTPTARSTVPEISHPRLLGPGEVFFTSGIVSTETISHQGRRHRLVRSAFILWTSQRTKKSRRLVWHARFPRVRLWRHRRTACHPFRLFTKSCAAYSHRVLQRLTWSTGNICAG